ncbi:MAG: helix-turn-helix domain-containing protein [Pseudomonadota bacterium]
MGVPKDESKAREATETLARNGGNKSAAAREIGISPSALRSRLENARLLKIPAAESSIRSPSIVPATTVVQRFLLTAAQDDTPIHEGFWGNLKAYADFLGAEIMVGGYTYQKGLFEDHSVAAGRFDQRIAPYLRPEVVDLGPRIVWYGKANILPTATDPLSGWETATREKWAVFPHAKIALRCVPVMPGAPGKQIMTTGVVTQPNYVQRNSGQKASFHHTIGATIVEVTPAGRHFCRQIVAVADGSFQDLDYCVHAGKVTTGNEVEAITWGDIHYEFLDPDVARGSWGFNVNTGLCDIEGSMLDVLRPRHGFVHDSFNFTARSHHTKNDPHERVKRIAEGRDAVEPEIAQTARFLAAIRRPWCTTVHVDSNHNQHLHKWLKDESAFRDPVNAAYWCELNAAALRAAEAGNSDFLIHEHALRAAMPDNLRGITFLRAGQSYQVCQATSPVECGLHADIGPNGAKGSAPAFARIVERANGAHLHYAVIRESYFGAGTSSLMNMVYNTKGPGSWSQSHTLTYPSSKRTIITLNGPEWRA